MTKESHLVKIEVGKLSRRGDGDTIDRLSATATVRILIVASIVISIGPFLAYPIECFAPAEMTDAMHQYIEKSCLIQDTYFLPSTEYLPQVRKAAKLKGVQKVSYYLWIPLILNLQAMMFYAPRVFWRLMSGISGVNFNAMLTMAHSCFSCLGKDPHSCFRDLADYIDWALNLHRVTRRRSSNWNILAKYNDMYLLVVYLITKLLYFVNAVGQIFLLSILLETSDPLYGITMARQLVNGTQWQQSGFFPRTTLCDIGIRDLATIRQYTVQCVLVENFFNEKVFIVLWYWTVFVAITSACSLVSCVFSTFSAGIRRRFVRRLLPRLPNDKDHPMAEIFTEFVSGYLGIHGVFLLRSISDRVGMVVAAKVIDFLWHDFVQGPGRSQFTFGKACGPWIEETEELETHESPIKNGSMERSKSNASALRPQSLSSGRVSSQSYGVAGNQSNLRRVAARHGYFRGIQDNNGTRSTSGPSMEIRQGVLLRRRDTKSTRADDRETVV